MSATPTNIGIRNRKISDTSLEKISAGKTAPEISESLRSKLQNLEGKNFTLIELL